MDMTRYWEEHPDGYQDTRRKRKKKKHTKKLDHSHVWQDGIIACPSGGGKLTLMHGRVCKICGRAECTVTYPWERGYSPWSDVTVPADASPSRIACAVREYGLIRQAEEAERKSRNAADGESVSGADGPAEPGLPVFRYGRTGCPVSGETQSAAEESAPEIGLPVWRASCGWCSVRSTEDLASVCTVSSGGEHADTEENNSAPQ